MKWTKARIAFLILHLLFAAVIPVVLIIIQYSTLGNYMADVVFAISTSGIILLLIVFLICKKIFIDKRLDNLRVQANLQLADLKVKQDPGEIRALQGQIRRARTIDVLVSSIFPVLFFVLAILCARALQNGLITLAGTLGFILISFFISIIFSVLYACQITPKGFNKRKGAENGE